MRTIFIGDVHGCSQELAELVHVLDPCCGDRVVLCGDLVGKGPASLDVLRDVQQILRTFPGSVCVAGNHEEKASRFHKKGKFMEPWCAQATPEDWDFINAMPLTWHDPALNVRVVHGGIFPSLLKNHPDVFERIDARGPNWRKGGGKVMERARRMLRVGYVRACTGDILALGQNQKGDPFWADTYDGSRGLVIYGHSPWLDGDVRYSGRDLLKRATAIGIDTACVFGGKLTAYVVETGKPDQIIQVDARAQYAEPYNEGDE